MSSCPEAEVRAAELTRGRRADGLASCRPKIWPCDHGQGSRCELTELRKHLDTASHGLAAGGPKKLAWIVTAKKNVGVMQAVPQWH